MYKKTFAMAGLAMLALTGCSSPSPAAKADSPKTFETAVELRDAFVDAGGQCPEWTQDNSVDIASQSGSCDGSTVLSVYLSRDAVERRVEATKGSIFGSIGGDWLVGENWIVNADELTGIQEKLGGQVVSFKN